MKNFIKYSLCVLFAVFSFLVTLSLEAHDHDYRAGYRAGYRDSYGHHDRVYVNDHWYHPHHVTYIDGGYYPNVYAGYPYYYYTPQYYYYPGDPGVSLSVHLGG